jgi:hypothetical protein
VRLKAERSPDIRQMAAGDRDAFVGAGVGMEKQRSLEALLNLSYPVQVDKEAAVDAEESLIVEFLLKAIEAPGSGQQPSLVAHQPDIVAVNLGEADLGWLEQNPSILPQGHNSPCDAVRASGAERRA